jgi:hypothetical protein
MKRYKELITDFKDNFLLEMSSHRQSAFVDIKGLMTPLLGHLIIISELGGKDKDYKKHIKELNSYKEKINKYNKKGKSSKWFNKYFLTQLSKDHIDRGIELFKKKYPHRKLSKQYESLNDFLWFNIIEEEK